MTTIYFDMDGTLCGFYDYPEWLECLLAENPLPYAIAKPRFRFSDFARRIHILQGKGYRVGIISWLSKNGSAEFNAMVTETKMIWLKNHLPSVVWDEIHIVEYGTPKSTVAEHDGYLFDDELKNRIEWGFETSFGVDNILETLKIF